LKRKVHAVKVEVKSISTGNHLVISQKICLKLCVWKVFWRRDITRESNISLFCIMDCTIYKRW